MGQAASRAEAACPTRLLKPLEGALPVRHAKTGLGWKGNWALVGLAAALAVPSFAGIRGPTVKVNDLTIDGHRYGGGSWEVSSPTLHFAR